jgi:putative ABC transport system permease protein
MSDEHPAPDGSQLFRPPVEREIEKELEFHIAMRVKDLVARGRSLEDAQRIAATELGDTTGVVDECKTIGRRRERQMNRSRIFDEMMQDIAFAFRLLRRRPMFATLAILTIALGIGAATSIFSVVDGVLLRALPFNDPSRLVAIWIAQPSLKNDPVIARLAERTVLGTEDFYALRDGATAYSDIALWGGGPSLLVGPTSTEQVHTVQVTASILDVLGEHVAMGRGIRPDENVLNGPKVALLGWECWTSRYGSDSSVLGRQITFDNGSYTIVGILPRGLRLDRTAAPADFWMPALQSQYDQPKYHNRSFFAIGRLKPGVTSAFATSEAIRLFRNASSDTTLSARVVNWQYDQTENTREPLYILLAASGLLLVIGCVNVAMLMLGEAASRERELAARIAIGASRTRVIRQLLVESVTLAFAGATLGAAFAWVFTRTLVSMAPARIPGIDSASVNLRALGFATVCAVIAGIAFGLAPALSIVRRSESALLRIGTGQSARQGRRIQQWLVATEIALSFVLLVGAVLLSRSLSRLGDVDPGFAARNIVTVKVAEPSTFRRDDVRRLAYYEEGVRRLAALPGVEAVSAGVNPPFGGGSSSSPVEVEGHVYASGHWAPSTEQRSVLPGYFAVLGVPIRAGRVFTDADNPNSELVAVISDATAKRDFPGEQPVGRRVKYQGELRRIIGVVGDVRASRLTRDAGPSLYTPLRQYGYGNVSFVIRSRANVATLAPSIRTALGAVEKTVSVSSITPMPTLVARSYAEESYRTVIVVAFAMLAAILATVGLYGVTARAVARRTREIGIRVALGATPIRAARLLMSDTLGGVLIGLAAGVPLSLLAGQRLSPFLFHVSSVDPVSFASVTTLLVGVAIIASGLPARRAGRSNPATVLSAE